MIDKYNRWNILKQKLNNKDKEIKFKARDIYFCQLDKILVKNLMEKVKNF